ncbi:MAG: cupin domain-containing protein [Taibaiella sp.]|nr:cupin domain-containing protein [Taibaiella sp.]
MTTRSPKYWIDKLSLTPHVEGGAFSEIYRSELLLPQNALTTEHHGPRNAMTSIYFLLEFGQFSAFHRIASDELWHHYDGGSLFIYEITPAGELKVHKLGVDSDASPFTVIKAGSWFGSRVETASSYTLCGCTVAPGFDFADFELAGRNSLAQLYPEHKGIIEALTRPE